MQVKQVIESKDGKAELIMELTEKQLQFLVEVGLSVLTKQGADLFLMNDDFKDHQITPDSESIQ